MDAFVALPGASERASAVIVAQEAFGVNDHIRGICRRLAGEGYVAIAPELYHRRGRGLVFRYDDYESVRPLILDLTNEGIESDLRTALGYVRSLPSVAGGRVGAVGFCMGGFVAFLAACRAGVAAAACFYGGGIVRQRPGARMRPLLPEAERIDCPILCVFGAEDASIPLEEVETLRRRLDELGKRAEVVAYPGAGHGFFCDERPSYSPEAAADAWRRTLEMLAEALK
jgi:carboxymethylenebutenolidase